MPLQILKSGEYDLRSIGDGDNASGTEGVSEAARAAVRRQVVSDSDPHVHISQLPADHVGATHSHSTDEVMVVLDGAVAVDGSECGPGSILLIPANLPYGLQTPQDKGVTFLIVRQTPGVYSQKTEVAAQG